MKILEFLNNNSNNSIVNEIKMLIFYDQKWMFPEIGLDIIRDSLEIEIEPNIKNLIEHIVFEMNNRNISPENWESEFDKIISKQKNT